MQNLLFAGAALAGVMLAAPGNAAVSVTDDPVLYWNQVLLTGLAGSPTVTSRGFAMVDVALHDAVNATFGSPNKGYLGAVPTPGGDTRAAASVAAHDVLVALNPGKAADFDAALAASLALVPNGAAKTNGMSTGAAIAAATLANRAGDGSNAIVPYTPSGLIGRWAPTPPANAPAAVPQWGKQNTWLLDSQSQFRAGPPPALTSAEYAAALNEVKDIGSATSLTRTADQTAAANFWVTASGTGPWLQAAMDASKAKGGYSSLEYASLFARLSVSLADTAIAIWDTKYTYDFWRPITAIRLADLDGNDQTAADPNWTSLIAAPPFPSYMSAHSAFAATAGDILTDAFGGGYAFCLTSAGANRCWASFTDAELDAGNSRIWGGIHFAFDNEAGLALGHQIAAFELKQKVFAPVPEPASWALMIAGFGMAGAVCRRRVTFALL